MSHNHSHPMNTQIFFYGKIIPTGRYNDERGIKPDIVLWNKRDTKGSIIDVIVPNDYALNRAKREKKLQNILN